MNHHLWKSLENHNLWKTKRRLQAPSLTFPLHSIPGSSWSLLEFPQFWGAQFRQSHPSLVTQLQNLHLISPPVLGLPHLFFYRLVTTILGFRQGQRVPA